MITNERDYVLSEIKTNVRILSTWGDAIAPSLEGKEVTVSERLDHFVKRAQTEFGMSIDEIDNAIRDYRNDAQELTP
jgi:hypothetical protein